MLGFFILVVILGMTLQSISMRDRLGFQIANLVEYHRSPQVRETEAGVPVVLETIITNHSRAPLFQLTISEPLPQYIVLKAMPDTDSERSAKGMNEDEAELTTLVERGGVLGIDLLNRLKRLEVQSNSYEMKSSLYISGKQRVRRKTLVEFQLRGVYTFAESELWNGDFLGLHTNLISKGNRSEIVVYPPRIKDLTAIASILDYLGEQHYDHTLYEDTLSTRSYRDYLPSDPMKYISWKQSAKRQSLVVREFDRICDDAVNIVLDISYRYTGDRTQYRSYLEYCFSAVRTLIDELHDTGTSFVFATNAFTPDRQQVYRVTNGQMDITRLYEILGRAKNVEMIPTGHLLARVSETNRSIVFIGMSRTTENMRLLNAMKNERGIRSYCLFADEEVAS